jgi:hypothetical protein
LNNPGIHGGNYIYRTIQVSVSNSGFPCVRKASFNSRLTIPHHGHRQSHEDLLTLAQIGHGVCIAVELSEVGFFRHRLLLADVAAVTSSQGIQQYSDSLG